MTGELRRELVGEYVAYMRDTGLADYRATPGNLAALIAVRDRYLLTKPDRVQHYESHGTFDAPSPG
ncbi:MAG: hypothetical protein QOF31_3536 [Mycobacterium sp.]|jgi:hypothetical protein|nr:hypothetical protein [Mycobacterium sp.]